MHHSYKSWGNQSWNTSFLFSLGGAWTYRIPFQHHQYHTVASFSKRLALTMQRYLVELAKRSLTRKYRHPNRTGQHNRDIPSNNWSHYKRLGHKFLKFRDLVRCHAKEVGHATTFSNCTTAITNFDVFAAKNKCNFCDVCSSRVNSAKPPTYCIIQRNRHTCKSATLNADLYIQLFWLFNS